MKPPYEITTRIFNLVASISEKIGEMRASQLTRPEVHLRKENRIHTIYGSLGIEGNRLTLLQMTALLENKRVVGPRKDITEVLNAIRTYDSLALFDPVSRESFLKAHGMLMDGLVENPGHYRSHAVGVFKGTEVVHVAPPAIKVHSLMNDLFDWLKKSDELPLIKSCVFHFETEFIHPFMDGNGRMGRLWQTLILMKTYPVFEFVPFESLIRQRQQEYYDVLAWCDKAGNSTRFIEFMLDVLDQSLAGMLDFNNRILTDSARLDYYTATGKDVFTRKDYMNVFKNLSTATASRDLRKGVEWKLLDREGNQRTTIYKIRKPN